MTFPDLVGVTRVTRSAVYHEESEAAEERVRAYVEDDSGVRYGPSGEPIAVAALVFMPRGTPIAVGDRVRVIRLHGRTASPAEQFASRKVSRVRVIGAFTESHVEASLGGEVR